MTLQEKIIVSAYTGVLMCDFNEVHAYIERKLGRPVWTHELAADDMRAEIKAATRDDFIDLCVTETSSGQTVEQCESTNFLYPHTL